MATNKNYGYWKDRKVLFIGDSLTAARLYPETVKDILGIEPYYHCKGGASLISMIDGDYGREGVYTPETDAQNIQRPLTPDDVRDMDLVVLYGGYNNRATNMGKVGDLYSPAGNGENTIAGFMQYAINRIYENLFKADNMTCRLLIVTVDCAGKYPWVDVDGRHESVPNTGWTFEAMANIQVEVARHNAIPCCDLFHTSGINEHTWAYFGACPYPENTNFTPYRLNEKGVPLSSERIRYVTGESYYQFRDGKVVLEKYEGVPPCPYNADQLHKSPAGYKRIGELIAGAIISAYGN